MKFKLLFLLFFLNSACQLDCMSRKTSFTVGIGATALGVGSLVWQLYTKDYSLKKSIVTGTLITSGITSLIYSNYAKVTSLPRSTKNNQLSNKAKVDEETLYALVSASNNYDEIKRLLDAGIIGPDEKIFGGDILHYSIVKREFDICKLVIDNGATVTLRDLENSILANDNIFDLILDSFDRSVLKERKSETLLLNAASHGTSHMVETFINFGFDLEVRDDFGYTPLLIATAHNNITAAKTLINAGADLNATTLSGDSVLNKVINAGLKELIVAKMISMESLSPTSLMYRDRKPQAMPQELLDRVISFATYK